MYMPTSAARPIVASPSPTATQGIFAQRWALGLVQTPQVMPIVHSPLAKWYTQARMPTSIRDRHDGRSLDGRRGGRRGAGRRRTFRRPAAG